MSMPAAKLSLAAAVAILAVGCSGQPRMECPRELDYGEIRLGNTAFAVTIPLRNAGDGEMQITRLTSSCGCLALECDSHRIAPGDSVHLRAKLRTDLAGRHHSTVTIECDDVEQPRRQILLAWFVKSACEFQPALVNCGRIRLGDSWSGKVVCYPEGELATVSVTSSSQVLEVGSELSDQTLAVTVRPTTAGQFREFVRVQRGEEVLGELEVVGEVVESISVAPQTVFASASDGSANFFVECWEFPSDAVEIRFQGVDGDVRDCRRLGDKAIFSVNLRKMHGAREEPGVVFIAGDAKLVVPVEWLE